METSFCSVALRCVFSPMGITYIRVSILRIHSSQNLTCAVRSVALLLAGWANIIIALTTQRRNHRSITLKSLWAMGFGRPNADGLIGYKQATEVRSNFSLTR